MGKKLIIAFSYNIIQSYVFSKHVAINVIRTVGFMIIAVKLWSNLFLFVIHEDEAINALNTSAADRR